ncbi:stearoyl-CoA 9-desaturase, partial [Teladorsagia circumcincta]
MQKRDRNGASGLENCKTGTSPRAHCQVAVIVAHHAIIGQSEGVEAFFLHVVGAIGVTAGAHRLWSHRAYKANLPYRIMLMLMDTTAFQNDIIEWARDHRCHHKWTDTHADPHNTNRGFFFSHMGWLLVKKHPQIKEQGKKLDLSDLFADPVLVFQR